MSHLIHILECGGYLIVYNTLPFGWKASPFIYQSVGMCVTVHLMIFALQNTLCIYDRFVVSRGSDSENDELNANRLVYILVELLTRLGYTLSLGKCSLVPSTCKKYLGFLVDSVRKAYILQDDKKQNLIQLRESILAESEVDLKTLQRFCGKCISMCLAVPGSKLFL